MDGDDKPPVSFKRFRSLMRPKPRPSKHYSGMAPGRPPTGSTDSLRTKERYIEAVRILHEATIKKRSNRWEKFECRELNGEPEGFHDSQFRRSLEQVLEAHKPDGADRNMWEIGKDNIQHLFNAFSPFAKRFLIIAKEVQSVPPIRSFRFLRDRFQL